VPVWNPTTYLQFADERSRPFFDLVGRVGAQDPRRVVDLGCGAGQLTAALADRWPAAEVLGLDSSPDMIERASEHVRPRLRFAVGDVRDWRAESGIDVIVSNALLQWVPDHRARLPGLVQALASGGWLGFAVPGNFAEPSHQLLRTLAADSRFAAATADVQFPASYDPEVYLSDLAACGCAVDAWETTYLHVLTGPDPVFRWISGTGARPVLQALDGESRAVFEAEYRGLLREAYLAGPDGRTLLRFRRVFVVARAAS
jgi:trans-aconitate 2-methyltransferase